MGHPLDIPLNLAGHSRQMDGGELCGQFLDASGLAPQKCFHLPGTHQGAEQAGNLGWLIRRRK